MVSPQNGETVNDNSLSNRMCCNFKALPHKVGEFTNKLKKLGREDPRRIIHSLKVGFALTLVSLFYYFQPLYEGFGDACIWAIMTVVVVFDFSVGATLGRGLNRMLATLAAGYLGVGCHRLALLTGDQIAEPVLIAIFVFIIASMVTYLRFMPEMKARYDYGLLIFNLTFSLIAISGYRDQDLIQTAFRRLTTIIIGSCVTVIVCIFICPVWVGEDLHKLIIGNMDKLGNFLEGFGAKYFSACPDGQSNKKEASLQKLGSVISSKSNEENMANLARWEPRHGRFRFRHPWKQYLRVGSLIRECAYKLESLNGYLNSDVQATFEVKSKIKESCTSICIETGKALKELASSAKKMTKPLSADPHITNSKLAAQNLEALLKAGVWENVELLQVIPAASVASLLLEVVTCTDRIAQCVNELASLAHFKSPKPKVVPDEQHLSDPEETSKPNQIAQASEQNAHVITIEGSSKTLGQSASYRRHQWGACIDV